MPRAMFAGAAALAAAFAIIAFGTGSASPPGQKPVRVGSCAFTRIKSVETRWSDGVTSRPVPNSGSAVRFHNGLGQVSYEQVPGVDRSRPGDAVFMCLIKRPHHCPRGDNRGKIYTTTNLRTDESWTLPDSEHMCGGA
jgi:hypothetical protein